jgi:hypothetical protein
MSNAVLLPAATSRAGAREYFSCEVSPKLRRWRSLPTSFGKHPRSQMPCQGEGPRADNFLQQYQLGQNRQARGVRENGASRDIAMPERKKTYGCQPNPS